jgi:uncharacterized DUF497 family protein
MDFRWDLNKETANISKHGVDFSEAQTVFADEAAIIEYDVEHSSEEEERWQISGYSTRHHLLKVVYTELDETTIRIISAWKIRPSNNP